MNLNQWARENIVFGPEEPFPGPYNDEKFPYFPPILDALSDDDPCQVVTIMKSAQLGGTIIIVIFVAVSMITGPIHFMYVQATESAARKWLAEKMGPVLKSVPALRRMFPINSKLAKNTDQEKGTEDGRGKIEALSAQSKDDLAQVSRPKQAQDDLSKWDENAAGDPEEQADDRSRAYEFRKILKVSTPLLWPGCKITRNYRAGSQEVWEVPCPHCGEYQALEWENFKANIDEENPDQSHFTCVHCGCEIHDYHRPKIMPLGRFVARNPKAMPIHRSFYLWTAHSPLQSFGALARKWLRVQGIPSAEQVFMNNDIGLAYEVIGEGAKTEDIRKRSEESHYDFGQVPAGYYVLVLGIDCQDNRVEWTLVAYGRNVRRAVIQTGIIQHHISEDAAKDELDQLIKRKWRNFAGHYLAISCTGIDANYARDDVGEWAKRHSKTKVIMVRGIGKDDLAPLVEVKHEWTKDGKRKPNRYRGRFFHFNANSYKMALYRSIRKITDPLARSHIAFPRGLSDDYCEQVCAEKRVARVGKTGFKKYLWEKDPNQANEGLDMLNQAEAAARRCGVFSVSDEFWDELEKEFGQPAPDAQLDLEDLLTLDGGQSSVGRDAMAATTAAGDDAIEDEEKPEVSALDALQAVLAGRADQKMPIEAELTAGGEVGSESPTLQKMRKLREARQKGRRA
ncbi:terminase gpA endonuclease subunit [uncultured Cohaesibacter sp.]|uniref:phage terminase large subunit family protein n=1 Tax=uncultured Cohaesibacter sp. TaxID=1002546 RepID=UPI0029C99E6E|nr:terminase gpA endonuclease subunit [uncultured Cohaesibacter sp.]